MDKKSMLVNRKIDENFGETLKSLQEFLSIPSVVSMPKGDYPFGEDVQKAFMYMLDKAEKDGFDTYNADNFGGHIEFGGKDSEEIMGIIGHVDVVPEGSYWDHPPYGGEVHDGKVYGRGALDDKGPVIASYYAMKALKDVGIVPSKKIRLVLGNDEERDWVGMRYYLQNVKEPDFGFTPDSEFPVIQGEKGLFFFDVVKKIRRSTKKDGLILMGLDGGTAANMVPDSAKAIIYHKDASVFDEIRKKAEEFRDTTIRELNRKFSEKAGKKSEGTVNGSCGNTSAIGDASIDCRVTGKSLEVLVRGLAAHGARACRGQNALAILMDFLGRFTFNNDDINDYISFFNKHIGYEIYGESMGVGFSDDKSGKLIFNAGMIKYSVNDIRLVASIRFPVTKTCRDIEDAMRPVLEENGYELELGKQNEAIYLESDDPLIVELMEAYRECTGDMENTPHIIGGSTYAKSFKNCVAYGPRFYDTPDVAHKKNECIDVGRLLTTTKIYANAMLRLACSKE